ncbi:MAG: endolytic transglycosylase MltG [Rhodospirillaceae bacterium]|nr:endolytic transglycosylase MltG [Rhodospirillaceae bacterium]
MPRVLRPLLFAAAGASLVIVGLAWGIARLYAPGPTESTQTVILPRGAGAARIANLLEDAGIIDEPWLFLAVAHFLGNARRLKAGEYAFPERISAMAALETVVAGNTVVRRLTVPEGQTVAQVLTLLAATAGLDEDTGPPPAEGELLPETYHFSYGDSRRQILDRMRHAMAAALVQQWEGRSPGLPLASPAAAVILASIVEKETARDDERARIAAVFYNRIRRSMRLQSDSTVIYGLTRGEGILNRALTHADLDTPTPYNTYLIAGLPRGPIANPGLASLAAVMNPAVTDELYFVADGTGGHAFARTLAEHNRNVARWQQLNRNTAPPPGGVSPSGAGSVPAGR